jgi:uncharacterized damage-inducible protein DinB
MSFLSHLVGLRHHGEWADRRLIDAVRATHAPLAVRELAHIRGTQELWLSRIEQRVPAVPVWPDTSVEELATIGVAVDAAWRRLFDSLTDDGLSRAVSYRSIAGDPFKTPLGEILLHTMLHGHYHRGKANAALHLAGGSPVSADYILWQWSGAPVPPAS